MLKKLKMRGKLVVFFGLLMLITIFTQGLVSFIELNKSHGSTIAAVQDEFDAVIRTSVEGLIGSLQANHQRYLDGEITKEEEMETAKKIARDTRYNNGEGYFWVDMADGLCAVHMDPEQEGKNRSNLEDLKGQNIVQNIIKAGNNEEGGFTEYYFKKPGEDEDFKKRGYTKKFEPYGWYVSTGNYYDDIEERLDEYKKDKQVSLLRMNVISVLLGIIGIIIMFVVANQITKHLRKMIQRITLLCQGDLHSPVPKMNTGDELQTLAIATSQTINNFGMVIYDIDNVMKEFSNGNFFY
ncbi:cache domain-containing protein [Anaerotignum sp. MB30-C6]|uniref:cache domain-containing protein n=1 Tax=Anaerotignum sp. MB30-C6 TaxID=3070814 RepID=UPI0027DB4291|nr:cache domain-containing protein [Anaerotignum sp. MB30-C6]WMI79800.1 cache domain-containing protein [Anaerotignum sp. MB30-C6]